MVEQGTMTVKRGLAQMLKGGVIMDVTTADQAKIAQEAGRTERLKTTIKRLHYWIVLESFFTSDSRDEFNWHRRAYPRPLVWLTRQGHVTR